MSHWCILILCIDCLLQHMEDEDEAKVAVAELNGYELEGSQIKVEVRYVLQ